MNTFAVALTAIISFAVTGLLGFKLIPWLRRLKYGQTILDIGPIWHKNKQGTPTMGGILFIVGTLLSMVLIVAVDYFTGGKYILGETPILKTKLWGGFAMAVGFALIGFFDDYIKVVKKRNLGLTVRQKTFLQLLISAGYLATLYMSGQRYTYIPFLGQVNLGIFYWIVSIVVIYFFVNAVNLTDGIDGLCSMVTFIVAVALMIAAGILQYRGMSALAAALAGACAGFLIWNWHPAKVFMGDTGSMFLGGFLVALAYGLDCPVILLPMGIVYIAEALSVVIQVLYYKRTHKRIFKMSPIHHHFEMSGWSEKKIVRVFSLVGAIGCAIGVLLLYFG